VTPVLLDTGAIVALLDRRENYHQAAIEAVQQSASPLITCEPVIAESCHLLRRIEGAREAVLANVEAGVFQIPVELPQCISAVRRTMAKYRDRPVDLADAFLIHLANEFKTGDILTLDRDFLVYPWGRNASFRSLIALN
jgi:predicted nucleic acid-binding protein